VTDPRTEKLAELSVKYSVAVRPKEKVVIQGNAAAFPLINELYKQCLLSGAYPSIVPELDTDFTFYRYAKQHQLEYVSPFSWLIAREMDVRIVVLCDPNPKRLTSIDPAKVRIRTAASKEIAETFSKRSAEGKLKWTLLPYPINAQAQEAAMALPEYEDFVYKSCMINKKGPATEWKKIEKRQDEICKYLEQKKEIQIVGQDTDLTCSVKGRKWINCSGTKNMPDGEVFTVPAENSVNGTIRFTFPGIMAGKEIEDIRLTFNKGKITKATAAKGNDLLQQLLKIDGAKTLGEASIGTNYEITKFTKNMLFDEKIGGTIHLALGNAYPEAGGLNKSAIHWDILKDMKKDSEIYADKEIFYKNGKFLK
jgi:aminopeptidase